MLFACVMAMAFFVLCQASLPQKQNEVMTNNFFYYPYFVPIPKKGEKGQNIHNIYSTVQTNISRSTHRCPQMLEPRIQNVTNHILGIEIRETTSSDLKNNKTRIENSTTSKEKKPEQTPASELQSSHKHMESINDEDNGSPDKNNGQIDRIVDENNRFTIRYRKQDNDTYKLFVNNNTECVVTDEKGFHSLTDQGGILETSKFLPSENAGEKGILIDMTSGCIVTDNNVEFSELIIMRHENNKTLVTLKDKNFVCNGASYEDIATVPCLILTIGLEKISTSCSPLLLIYKNRDTTSMFVGKDNKNRDKINTNKVYTFVINQLVKKRSICPIEYKVDENKLFYQHENSKETLALKPEPASKALLNFLVEKWSLIPRKNSPM